MTPAHMTAVALLMHDVSGAVPRSTDFRSPYRQNWETQLKLPLPTLDVIQRAFGGFTHFLVACGLRPLEAKSGFGDIEIAAIRHVEDVLGLDAETYERSITDGHLPNGESCEVKGSVLRLHKTLRLPYFAWKLHKRLYSVSCDRLVLVGLGRGLEPIVRVELAGPQLPSMADGKQNLFVYARGIWGDGDSMVRPFIKWRTPGSLAAVVDAFMRVAPPTEVQ